MFDMSVFVAVTAVDGDFDFCQRAVKHLMTDAQFQRQLLDNCDVRLRQVHSPHLLPSMQYFLHILNELCEINYYNYTDTYVTSRRVTAGHDGQLHS